MHVQCTQVQFANPPGYCDAMLGSHLSRFSMDSQIVGFYIDANGIEHGFLRQGSSFFYVNTSGADINFHAAVKAFE